MGSHEKYKGKGLVVLMVSDEEKGKVAPYVTANKIPFIVAGVKDADFKAYGVQGIPHAFLLDGSGKIVWEGFPAALQPATIESALKSVVLVTVGPVAPSLTPAKADLEAGRYAEATRKAKAVQAGASVTDAQKADAKSILDAIGKVSDTQLAQADDAAAAGDLTGAVDTLKRIQERFKGLEAEKQAAQKEKEFRAKPEFKREQEASSVLKQLLAQEAAIRKPRDKRTLIPTFESFAKKYAGTAAAHEAEQKAKALKEMPD